MTSFLSRLWPLALFSLGLGAFTLAMFAYNRALLRSSNRFAPDYYPQMLPFLFFVSLLYSVFTAPSFSAPLRMLATTIAYSALLWALTKPLRRHISAQGCVALWLLPNLFFYVSWFLRDYSFIDPLFVVRLPRSALWIVLGVWAAGFAAVLVWKLVSHLHFRKAVLRDAIPVTTRERDLFLTAWRALCFAGNARPAGFKGNMKSGRKVIVLRSPAVDSPLTVGLLGKKRCLVLPQRDYSEDELWLIFRHESIHLLRQDNWLKFTLSFLCAAGWFIPMLWLGLGKAAEDIELCCDELATAGIEENRRRDYADLLLTNVGSPKGFTTCLSTSASGLRYRLARVLRPEKRRAGFPAVFLLSCFVFFLFGMAGFSSIGGTVQTELLDRDGGGWQIKSVMQLPDGAPASGFCDEPAPCEQIADAIRGLRLEKPLDHSKVMGKAMIEFYLRRGDEWIRGCLYENGLELYEPGQEYPLERAETFLFSDPAQVDLAALRDLIPIVPETQD